MHGWCGAKEQAAAPRTCLLLRHCSCDQGVTKGAETQDVPVEWGVHGEHIGKQSIVVCGGDAPNA